MKYCELCNPNVAGIGDTYDAIKKRAEYMRWLRSQMSAQQVCPIGALCKPLIDANTELYDTTASIYDGLDLD